MNESPRLFELPPLPAVVGESRLSSSMLGGMAELEAVLALARRGHKVARPVVDDDGIDLIVDYRICVQVKSSSGGQEGAVYSFSFGSGRDRRAYARGQRADIRADFVLCFASDIAVWWVVPRAWLYEAGYESSRRGFSLSANPNLQTKYGGLAVRCREAWHLFGA
jgi:hypothetical protein